MALVSSTFKAAVKRSRDRANFIRAARKGGASNKAISEALKSEAEFTRATQVLEAEKRGANISASVLEDAKSKVVLEEKVLTEAQAQQLLNDVSRQERDRLREKYPDSKQFVNRQNIKNKIISGSQLRESERVYYPSYDGRLTSDVWSSGKARIMATAKSDEVYLPQFASQYGSEMPFVRELHARDKVPFGGVMGGLLTPESAREQGFNRIVNRVALKDAVIFPKFELKVTDKKSFNVGDKSFDTLGKADFYIRDSEAQYWRDIGVYDGLTPPPQTKYVVNNLLAPQPMEINNVRVLPAGLNFGLGLPSEGVTYRQNYVIDSSDLDVAGDYALKHWKSKIPLWSSIQNPILDYAVADWKSVEIKKRVGLVNAKTGKDLKEVDETYLRELNEISNPLVFHVTPDVLPAKGYKTSSERIRDFDIIPWVDVRPSPGAMAGLVGSQVGLAWGGGASAGLFAKGTSGMLPGVVGAVRGGGSLGVGIVGGEYVARETGSPLLGVGATMVLSASVWSGSGVIKNKIFPYNRLEVVSNSMKSTSAFKVGGIDKASTVSRDIFSGRGVSLNSRVGGVSLSGRGVASELPVFVKASNILGESKLVPTYSALARFSSANTGLGLAIKPTSDKMVWGGDSFELSPASVSKRPQYIWGERGGVSPLSVRVGGRVPVAGQDVFTSVLVGKAKAGFHGVYGGTLTQKNIGGLDNVYSLDLFKMRGGGGVAPYGSNIVKLNRFDLGVVKSSSFGSNSVSGWDVMRFKSAGVSGVKYTPKYLEVFKSLDVGGGSSKSPVVGGGGFDVVRSVSGSSKAPASVWSGSGFNVVKSVRPSPVSTPIKSGGGLYSLGRMDVVADVRSSVLSMARMDSASAVVQSSFNSQASPIVAVGVVTPKTSKASGVSRINTITSSLSSVSALAQGVKSKVKLKSGPLVVVSSSKSNLSALSVVSKAQVSPQKVTGSRSGSQLIIKSDLVNQQKLKSKISIGLQIPKPSIITKSFVPGPVIPTPAFKFPLGGGGGGLFGGLGRGGFALRSFKQRRIKLPGLSAREFLGGGRLLSADALKKVKIKTRWAVVKKKKKKVRRKIKFKKWGKK